MASYTDKAPTFSPYVAQKPVEIMAKVGMQKQDQYEQGYKKIQDSIDNIAGLDIVRPQDKAHLQTKLNELGTKLQGVAAADFSNFQLSNSVAGMASSLIKDKGISGSVAATQRYKKEQQYVEAAKKDGTLTPDNLLHYQKQVKTYFDDQEVGAAFNGQYKPHFDIFKFVKETFDEVLPDEMTIDMVFELDGKGNPVIDKKTGDFIYAPAMKRLVKEGRFPEKVKQTINQIFSDPRVAQQLQITGEYNYQGINSDGLSQKIVTQKENVLNALDKELQRLTIKSSAGEDVQEEIDALKKAQTRATTVYDDLNKTAYSNPEAIRGMLYEDEVRSRYTTMFGQIKTKELAMSNPYWDANFSLVKEANLQSRWFQDHMQTERKNIQTQKNWKATFDQRALLAQQKIDAENKGSDGSGTGPPGSGGTRQDFELSNMDVVSMQQQNYEQAALNLENTTNEILWDVIYSKDPINEKRLDEMMIEAGLTRTQALTLMTKETANRIVLDEELQNINEQRKNEGKDPLTKVDVYTTSTMNNIITGYNAMDPSLRRKNYSKKELFKSYTRAKKTFSAERAINETIDNVILKEFKNLKDKEIMGGIEPQTIVFEDNEYELSKNDIMDLAIIRRKGHQYLGFLANQTADKAAKQAEGRLRARGNDALITAIRRDKVLSDAPTQPISSLIRGVVDQNPIARGYRALRYKTESNYNQGFLKRDWSQVDAVVDLISNPESLERIERRAELTNKLYIKNPNLATGLLTGNTEINKRTVNILGEFAGNYLANGQNMSSSFKDFAAKINNTIAEDYKLGTGIVMNELNEPTVEVKLYANNNDLIGTMVVTPKEAHEISVEVGALYDTDEVRNVRLTITDKMGKTSDGDPEKVSTYLDDDAYFSIYDFPFLEEYDEILNIKANIKKSGGKFYPYIFVQYKDAKMVEPLQGSDNLGQVMMTLQNVKLELINSLISEYYAKQESDNIQQ